MIILTPTSTKAKEWMQKNVVAEDWQKIGNGIVTETRLAFRILEAMKEEGLKPEKDYDAFRTI